LDPNRKHQPGQGFCAPTSNIAGCDIEIACPAMACIGMGNMTEEARIRHSLRRALLDAGQSWLTVEEFWLPRSNVRADVVTVGAELHAYEIKSSVDTLKRLPRQVEAYGQLFDRCTAVLADPHVDAAIAILPDVWGVLQATSGKCGMTLHSIRTSRANPDVDQELLVRLLWREEAHAALVELGHPVDARSSRASLWRALLEATDLEGLRRLVRDTIRRRNPGSARIPTRRFTQLAHEAGL
jgi:hypothetical protein